MIHTVQLSLEEYFEDSVFAANTSLRDAVAKLATDAGEARGAIYTRIEVVEFILDLVGYTPDHDLSKTQILEPSFGNGEFLLSIIGRLITSWENHHNHAPIDVFSIVHSIRAVEIHYETFFSTKHLVTEKLIDAGISKSDAAFLAESWLVQGDFLIENQTTTFDFIVGNPPYLRQEAIPAVLLKEYRTRYKTMFDRADIYIAFIERALSLLQPNGALGFICSDRWMKNRYGGPLRNLIAREFYLSIYVDMVGTDAFHTDVSAYPAITIVKRQKQGITRIARKPLLDTEYLNRLASVLTSPQFSQTTEINEVSGLVDGTEPWLIDATDQLCVLRRIEARYPKIEDTGCKIGIGVATGADKVFIQDYYALDVEEDRKLKLVTTRDIRSGQVVWQGQGVINTFNDDGGTVDLNAYPKLKELLNCNADIIKQRHVAKQNPESWFRTIDRVWPELSRKPKLLIPDIKGEAHVVYDSGEYYPHHNLYYITSNSWDLKALQAVLLSKITQMFIAFYSTKMRGGYLRFQAQYLRRLRIPKWENVNESLRIELIDAAENKDIQRCNFAVANLYNLSQEERTLLGLEDEQNGY